jgi:hypothetical protein
MGAAGSDKAKDAKQDEQNAEANGQLCHDCQELLGGSMSG